MPACRACSKPQGTEEGEGSKPEPGQNPDRADCHVTPPWQHAGVAPYRRTDEMQLRKLTVRLLEDVYEAFATTARSKGMSINALANKLIQDYLAAQDHAPVAEWLHQTEEDHLRRLERIRAFAWP